MNEVIAVPALPAVGDPYGRDRPSPKTAEFRHLRMASPRPLYHRTIHPAIVAAYGTAKGLSQNEALSLAGSKLVLSGKISEARKGYIIIGQQLRGTLRHQCVQSWPDRPAFLPNQ